MSKNFLFIEILLFLKANACELRWEANKLLLLVNKQRHKHDQNGLECTFKSRLNFVYKLCVLLYCKAK